MKYPEVPASISPSFLTKVMKPNGDLGASKSLHILYKSAKKIIMESGPKSFKKTYMVGKVYDG